ncbi:hypothetical protein N7466_000335 [Penicillium verhagenii]|uniref:uncharacterized protein n=1 Tax=Penicillium verhagenii TaxID=1562060 RepID=UPI002544E258|nr:uncharacterized protein N7466_000335 [Penicillium verhagenii]KAJ5947320.1 hypothetical protein N7466_000335 [Penicillium verhagenii]
MSEKDVSRFLKRPGSSPRFVYGVLMLPTVLKYYIGMEQRCEIHNSMTQATISGYQLHQYAESSSPVITPSSDPKAIVEGMLIFNLNEQQRNALYEFEAGLMHLTSVQVEICEKDADQMHQLHTVDAGAFTWTDSTQGMTRVSDSSLCIGKFLNSPFYRSSVEVREWGN